MYTSCAHVYIHFVWRTWDSLPIIAPEWEERVYACIGKSCTDLKCTPILINGMPDHIHVLVRLHSTVSVAALAKQMKGDSSHYVNHVIAPETCFQWQRTYGAFSVSKDGVIAVREYIRNQKQHHSQGTLTDEWEKSWVEQVPNV